MNPGVLAIDARQDQRPEVADMSTSKSTRKAPTTGGNPQSPAPAQTRNGVRPAVLAGDVSASEHLIESPSQTRNSRLTYRFTGTIAALCDWLAEPHIERRRLFDSEMVTLQHIGHEVRRRLP